VLVLGVILALVGCPRKTKSDEEWKAEQEAQQKQAIAPLMAKYKDKVKPIITGIQAAFADARKAPPVMQREPIADGAELPKPDAFSQVLVRGDSRSQDADPAARLNLADNQLGDVAKVLDGGLYDAEMMTPSALESELESLQNKRWIAVVRVRHYQPPLVKGDKFDGANADGDAVLYSLPDHKRIGAFPWQFAQRLDKITVVGGYDAVRELERKFAGETLSTTSDELVAYLAGKPGIATPGNREADAMAAHDEAERGRPLLQLELRASLVQVPFGHKPVILASIDKVEVAPGEPKQTVTIYSDSPSDLEPIRAELAAVVAKQLGAQADLRIVKSPQP
jgi:hypothetical protein